MGNTASNTPAGQLLSSLGRKAKSEATLVASGNRAAPSSPTAAPKTPALRNFTVQELAEFTGEHDKPMYISLLSDVFDVTADVVEYRASDFCVLAGHDASRALARMSLVADEAANLDLSDLTPTQRESLDTWMRTFCDVKQYPKVGRLLLPTREYTLDELRPFNGVDNLRRIVLVGLHGNVYDVTLHGWEHYGPDGGYAQFAGRDASRALACMSFSDECLDDPSLAELTDEQMATLANWAARFDAKYPIVGRLV